MTKQELMVESNVWLTAELKTEIKAVFEARYKRSLTDNEVVEIAENLSTVIEEIIKLKWKQKYEPKYI